VKRQIPTGVAAHQEPRQAEGRLSAGNRVKRSGSHVAVSADEADRFVTKNVGRADSALRIAVGFVLAPMCMLIAAPVWIPVTLAAIAAFGPVTAF
jgi:ethanolamine utilization microcompartment shell protein EutL